METIEYFKSELLLSHSYSILIFHEYCLEILVKLFVTNVDFEKMIKSTDLQIISLMTKGFYCSTVDFANNHGKTSNPESEHYQKVIPTLFDEAEFNEIIDSVFFLLKDFSNQAERAYWWLIEDVEPRKNQMDALVNFLEILGENNLKKDSEDSQLNESAEKVIEECLHKNRGHEIYAIQKREELGIFTPDKELLMNISRILNYLDILSYGDHIKVLITDHGLKFRQ